MPTLTCKYCGTPVPPEKVDPVQLIARCPQCGAVFGIATQLAHVPSAPPAAPTAAPRPYDRPPVPLPANITVARDGAELRLTRHWRSWQGAVLLGFSLFWCGSLVPFILVFASIISQGGREVMGMMAPMLLFFSLFPLVGLLLLYMAVAQLFNRTVITVNPEMLDLYSGPLWVPGDRRFRPADVQQLYCVEHRRRSSSGRRSSFSHTYYVYEVRVQLRNGGTRNLLPDLPAAAQALYIEQEIERFLGLQDVPVQGELSRV